MNKFNPGYAVTYILLTNQLERSVIWQTRRLARSSMIFHLLRHLPRTSQAHASSGADLGTSFVKIFVLDPFLYTAPYDFALVGAISQLGVDVTLLTDYAQRGADPACVSASNVRKFFGKVSQNIGDQREKLRRAVRTAEYPLDLWRCSAAIRRERPDVVHIQWLVIPSIDYLFIRWLKRRCVVVITMHDIEPLNGTQRSVVQILGYHHALRLAHAVVVHTPSSANDLRRRATDTKASVIPHGPLQLERLSSSSGSDVRYMFLAVGRLRPYKGLDILIDATAKLPMEVREAVRVVIAGEPLMPLAPLYDQVRSLDLCSTVDIIPGFMSERSLAELCESTNCFVFPYRQMDASGVFHLVAQMGRWMIASDVGAFSETITNGVTGELIPASDAAALARAMARAVEQRPVVDEPIELTSWSTIGSMTVELYGSLVAARAGGTRT